MATHRYSNSTTFSGGFSVKGQEPIDDRLIVEKIEHIYLAETWAGKGLYNGMVVSSKDGDVRVLKDRANYTSEDSWVKISGDFNGIFNDKVDLEA